MTTTERAVAYVPLDELAPNPLNAKEHDLGLIYQSLGRFGIADLPVLDGRTGMIVSGHGRRDALAMIRDAGMDAPNGVRVDDDRWMIPVVTGWSSKNDAEASSYLLAANKTQEQGGWDDGALATLLGTLAEQDIDLLDGTGFDGTDLDDLRARLEEPLDPRAGLGRLRNDEGDAIDGTTVDKTYDQFLERYAERTVRSLMLDFKADTYSWVVAGLDAMRQDGESNSDIVLRLLSVATGMDAPDAA